MKTLEIGELESSLRACLAALPDGETVLVKDGQTAIARLVKVPQYADKTLDPMEANLRALEAEGRLTRSKRKIDWNEFLSTEGPYVSDEAMKEALEWARGDTFQPTGIRAV